MEAPNVEPEQAAIDEPEQAAIDEPEQEDPNPEPPLAEDDEAQISDEGPGEATDEDPVPYCPVGRATISNKTTAQGQCRKLAFKKKRIN